MSSNKAAINIRLSAAQVSVIWPGLAFIASAYLIRRSGRSVEYEYPFRVQPPPQGFDHGVCDATLMEQLLDLRSRLKPQAKTGGRVQMDAIDLRIAILAIRVSLDRWRMEAHDRRRRDPETKEWLCLDRASGQKLKMKSQRVILSLERHMKRANRLLLKVVHSDQYSELTKRWKALLRWIRLHLAYFTPFRPSRRFLRKLQRGFIDYLVKVAEEGLRYQAYEIPDAGEMRRMMRMYARYARRGNGSSFDFEQLLHKRANLDTKCSLADFAILRLNLKELPTR